MRRKLYERMLEWKRTSGGDSALMVEGARRVGKSYIVEEFAKNEYESYLLIDFNNTLSQIKDLFGMYLSDLDTFYNYLELYSGARLVRRKSLIIFDEVQQFPPARAAIKYLVKDGRYDFIETGSLVSIRKNVKDIMIPSEEETVQLNPMDFEEFLWAMGEDNFMDLIRIQFGKLEPMGPDMHRKAMSLFRQYMVTGGMPQAVEKYAQTRDLNQTDRVKRLIINLYRNDIQRYSNGLETKVSRIFEEVPSQLQRHEKKYRLADLEEDARYRDYDAAFFWLSEAKVVNICYNSTEPNVGYRLTRDGNTLKCYMADTGLLVSMAFDENGAVPEGLYRKLMLDKLEVNKGMLTENIVAQMLTASGHKLYFFSSYSKSNAADRMEIDFLISKSGITSRHNVSAIEVKSGTNYTTVSLEKFKAKYGNMLHRCYILHSGDLSFDNGKGIIYLPIYMAGLL